MTSQPSGSQVACAGVSSCWIGPNGPVPRSPGGTCWRCQCWWWQAWLAYPKACGRSAQMSVMVNGVAWFPDLWKACLGASGRFSGPVVRTLGVCTCACGDQWVGWPFGPWLVSLDTGMEGGVGLSSSSPDKTHRCKLWCTGRGYPQTSSCLCLGASSSWHSEPIVRLPYGVYVLSGWLMGKGNPPAPRWLSWWVSRGGARPWELVLVPPDGIYKQRLWWAGWGNPQAPRLLCLGGSRSLIDGQGEPVLKVYASACCLWCREGGAAVSGSGPWQVAVRLWENMLQLPLFWWQPSCAVYLFHRVYSNMWTRVLGILSNCWGPCHTDANFQ